LSRIQTLFCLIAAAGLVLISACSRDEPLDDVDAFGLAYEAMPRAEARDALLPLVDDPPPTGAYARYHLGNLYYADATDSAYTAGWNDPFVKARLDSAQRWLEAAVAADSTMVKAFVNLGVLWDDRAEMMTSRAERDERIGRARAMFEAALALDPLDEKARCGLGNLWKRQNKLEQAMQEYLTVLDQNPRSALARYNLGILFATQRIYGEAEREFALAAKYDPDGDIGERSRDNIQIIHDLRTAELERAGDR